MIIKDNEVADLETPTGTMRAHIFRPAAPGKYPGILMFSEIFQVTAPIRRTAAMLAGHGFVVACPEIYHELEPLGSVLAYDEEGTTRGNAHKITKELSSYDSDARAVLDYLKTLDYCTGRLGVMGICIGGTSNGGVALDQSANTITINVTALGVIIGIVAITMMGTAINGIDRGFDKSLANAGLGRCNHTTAAVTWVR